MQQNILAKLFIIFYLLFMLPFATATELNNSNGAIDVNSFLNPNQVFNVEIGSQNQQQIFLNFTIHPGYYIYQKTLSIRTEPEGGIDFKQINYPTPIFIADAANKGKKEAVYAQNFTLDLKLKPQVNLNELVVVLQGCDGKSICYPPQTFTFALTAIANKHKSASNEVVNISKKTIHTTFTDFYRGDLSSSNLLNEFSFMQLIIIFFFAGILIALTPCMYPLYPIALSSIVSAVSLKNKRQVFIVVLTYIHGLAIVYMLIGFLAAFTGRLFTTMIQTPVIMMVSGIIWLVLGFAMLDLIEVKLPNRIQAYFHTKANNISSKGYFKVFILGIMSSIILGPCVTPPLVAAIGFIAGKGNVILGAACLYMLTLGMCLPILIIATLGGNLLPKSGPWMAWVKYVMGLLIIVVSIYLTYPFINLPNSYINIGMICTVIAILFLIVKNFKRNGIELLIHKLIPIVLLITGIVFNYYGIMIKNAQSNSQQMTSISPLVAGKTNIVTTASSLNQIIATSTKPVVIDFYASWCVICKEMEQTTFKDNMVNQLLKNKYTYVKFDITTNTHDQLQVLK
ncbi:MAG: protein-disulfide reductase DsbD, partial [Pseudomonadota bacterium]